MSRGWVLFRYCSMAFNISLQFVWQFGDSHFPIATNALKHRGLTWRLDSMKTVHSRTMIALGPG